MLSPIAKTVMLLILVPNVKPVTGTIYFEELHLQACRRPDLGRVALTESSAFGFGFRVEGVGFRNFVLGVGCRMLGFGVQGAHEVANFFVCTMSCGVSWVLVSNELAKQQLLSNPG